MNRLRIVPVERDGSVAVTGELPPFASDCCVMSAAWYKKVGFEPPWIGYLAFDGEKCVAVGGFKIAPQDGAVEIAYGTLEEHRGRGYATQLARQLIELAHATSPGILVTAQTLPQPNESTSILKKLGFTCIGEVNHPEDGIVWEWHLPKESI